MRRICHERKTNVHSFICSLGTELRAKSSSQMQFCDYYRTEWCLQGPRVWSAQEILFQAENWGEICDIWNKPQFVQSMGTQSEKLLVWLQNSSKWRFHSVWVFDCQTYLKGERGKVPLKGQERQCLSLRKIWLSCWATNSVLTVCVEHCSYLWRSNF